jgi:hypothetical protein
MATACRGLKFATNPDSLAQMVELPRSLETLFKKCIASLGHRSGAACCRCRGDDVAVQRRKLILVAGSDLLHTCQHRN